MPELTLIYRRLDELITHRSTGTPEELALKLGISKRQLLNYLKDIKDLENTNISYSRNYKSYLYKNE